MCKPENYGITIIFIMLVGTVHTGTVIELGFMADVSALWVCEHKTTDITRSFVKIKSNK